MGLSYTKHVYVLVWLLLGLLLAAPSWQGATPAYPLCKAGSDASCIPYDTDLLDSGRDILQTNSADTTHPAEHKSLLPTTQYDVAMFVIAGIVLFVAAGAGMGGGPVLVPVYLTLGGFLQQAAVALSNSTILAGSVANVLVNARKRHPFKNRPLVDWDLILLMQPPTLIGAIAGSFINKLVPAWISHLLLAVLLTLMAIRVVQRAVRMYSKETAAMTQQTGDPVCCGGPTVAGTTAAGEQDPAQSSQHQAAPILQLAVSPAVVNNSTDEGNKHKGALDSPPATHPIVMHAPVSSSSSARASSAGGAVTVQLAVMTPANGCARAVHSPIAASAVATAACDSTVTAAAGVTGIPDRTLLGTSTPPAEFLQGQVSLQQQNAHAQQHKQRQQHPNTRSSMDSSSSMPDELAPNEAECRLAYAPPGHIRRSSWELQEGWDDAWESHDSSEEENISAQQLGVLHEHAGGHGAGNAEAVAAGAAKLLHAGRAYSAPVADAVAAVPSAAAKQQAGTSSAGRPAALMTSSSVLCFGATAAPPQLGAESPSPTFDARAIIHKPASPHDTDATDSRPSSVLAKYLKPRPRRQPPELSINSPELQTFLIAEAAQLPLMPVVLLAVMFVAVLLTSLFKKTAKCGSVAYWLVQAAVVPVLLGVWWFGRSRVLRKVAVKRSAGLDFHGDIRWTHNNSIVFPAICSFAGVMAGMFGLGGAVVTTPIMLELGMHPQVTAATSQTMLLLTTAASTIVYSQLGDIPWNYASVLMPMAFAATLAGQFAIDKVVAKLQRSSAIVIVVAGFFVVACCLTYYVVVDSLRGVVADPAGASVPGRLCGR